MTQQEIIKLLNLTPLPGEGGYFRQLYKSELTVLATGQNDTRAASTAIYYLITKDEFSSFHRVKSDELFHFYLGDTVEMVQITGDKLLEFRLGQKLTQGEELQVLVHALSWQALRVAQGGEWALLGATVSPGFEYEDFELGDRAKMIEEFPQHRDIIERYTNASTSLKHSVS